jgi:iron-sulfur cluster assembly accessory protein
MSIVTITEKARDYLSNVAKDGALVSLSVQGGGCSGFQYKWGLTTDAKHNDFDWSDPIDDVLVVCPLSEMYLLGSQVDYVEELGGSFLAVKNPMSTSSCGCGESFGA